MFYCPACFFTALAEFGHVAQSAVAVRFFNSFSSALAEDVR